MSPGPAPKRPRAWPALIAATWAALAALVPSPVDAQPVVPLPPARPRGAPLPTEGDDPAEAGRRGRFAVGLGYSMALAAGETADFIDDFSFRGLRFDLRYFVHDAVTVGFATGWQFFDDRTRSTIERPEAALTATQLRTIETLPVLATAHGYLRLTDGFTLSGGLGLGASFQQRQADIGVLSFTDDAWHFNLVPEVSLLADVGGFDLVGTLRFHWAAEADLDPLLFFTFEVGILTF